MNGSDRLNPLSGPDALELFIRAIEEAGCPRETTMQILAGEDPRPRFPLPDGTELRVDYVPAPDYDKAREAFIRLCAEQIGVPITQHRREAFLREFRQLRYDLADAVRAAALHDWEEVDEGIREALNDPPEPDGGPTWNRWARRTWKKIRHNVMAGPLWREVMGEDARKGEDKTHIELDADEMPPLPDPGDQTRHEVNAMLADTEEARLRALADLTPSEERVWILHYYQDLAPSDISERSGQAASTVRVLLHRAREKMQAVYGG